MRICFAIVHVLVFSTLSVLALATDRAGAAEAGTAEEGSEVVWRIGDKEVTVAEVAAELRYARPEPLAALAYDSNAAGRYAFDWYTRRIFEVAAQRGDLFERRPGLQEAAAEMGRRLITAEYMADLLATRYAPTDRERSQTYKIEGDTLCAKPARYRLAEIFFASGRRAGPKELEGLRERVGAVQKRLESGESFSSLADEVSDRGAAGSGGQLVWTTDAQIEGAPGAERIRGLAVGARTEAIDVPDGKVFFMLLEKEEAGRESLEQCQPKIDRAINKKFVRELVIGRTEELAEEYDSAFFPDRFLEAASQAVAAGPNRPGGR